MISESPRISLEKPLAKPISIFLSELTIIRIKLVFLAELVAFLSLMGRLHLDEKPLNVGESLRGSNLDLKASKLRRLDPNTEK